MEKRRYVLGPMENRAHGNNGVKVALSHLACACHSRCRGDESRANAPDFPFVEAAVPAIKNAAAGEEIKYDKKVDGNVGKSRINNDPYECFLPFAESFYP